MTAAGKSRAFVNDTPVALTTLRELGDQLVDIHSQHQNLLINKEDFQLSVIDIIADDSQVLDDYRTSYHQLKAVERQLEQLREDIRRNRDNEEFLRFQHQELSGAKLAEGEQEQLEQEYGILSHAEEIKSALFEADELFSGDGGIVEKLKSASHSIDSVRNVFPDITEAAERIESSFIELKDIADEVARHAEHIDFDPARMEEVNSRLDTIYHLQQKFHVQTVEELIGTRDNLERQLGQIDGGDEALQELEAQEATLLRGDAQPTRPIRHSQSEI